MATRRMFSKEITESDAFRDMPLSTQAFYFHLGLAADDDGVVNNPKTIQRCIGASLDDLKILIAKEFVIPFEESGIIVVKHWRINNLIQKDRYNPSKHQKELRQLGKDENKVYYLMDTNCIQNGTTDKERIEKNRLDKNSLVQSSEALVKDNESSNKAYNDAGYLFLLLLNHRYDSYDNRDPYVSYFMDLINREITTKELENYINEFFGDDFDEDDIEGDRYQYFVNTFNNLINPSIDSNYSGHIDSTEVNDDDLPF